MFYRDTQLSKLERRQSAYYIAESTGERSQGRLCIKVPKATKSGTPAPCAFYFRYYKARRPVFISVGKQPSTLRNARLKCAEYTAMLAGGLDPKDELFRQQQERDKLNSSATFGELINHYIDSLNRRAARSAKVVESTIRRTMRQIPCQQLARTVTTEQVRQCIAEYIHTPQYANRARSYIHAAFQCALHADNDPRRVGCPLFNLKANPVSAIPAQRVSPDSSSYLLHDDVVQLFDDIHAGELAPFEGGALIMLCFHLGGQRISEVMHTRWADIDIQRKTLLITADISKTGRPNLIPLTNTACQLLEELQPYSTNGAILERSAGWLYDVVKRYRARGQGRPAFTPRDIRRTCKTLMGEIGLSKEIRDRLQNHSLSDVSSKHYDRYSYFKEKQAALLAWESRLNNEQQQQLDDRRVVNISNFKNN